VYCDIADHAFVPALVASWRSIRDEFERIAPSRFMAWHERFLYDEGWDVFGLHAFGQKLQENCDRCPETTRAVEAIPGLRTAGFSILQPGTHIRSHVGYTNEVLRCHLGLVVPDGCEMRVGHEIRSWQEGHCLVFDDTMEHEVWHRGATPRAILLIDFARSPP
jgi:beta-hydroxylase